MNDDKTQVLIVEMCTRSPPFVTFGSTSLTNCYGTSQSGQKAEEKCDEDELLNTAKFNCTHAMRLEMRSDNISSGDHVEYSRHLDWIRFCYVMRLKYTGLTVLVYSIQKFPLWREPIQTLQIRRTDSSGKRIRKEKVAVSVVSGYAWTGPKHKAKTRKDLD